MGFHFAADLFGDAVDLVEQRVAGSVEDVGVGRGAALGMNHGEIADVGDPLLDQRATLVFLVAGQNQRRVQGIEVAFHRVAHLGIEGQIARVAAFLEGAPFRVHGSEQRRDGVQALELDFLRVGEGSVKANAVERRHQVDGEKKEESQVAEKTQHEPPGHAHVNFAGFGKGIQFAQAGIVARD